LIVVRDMISTLHRWTLSAGAVVKRPLDLKWRELQAYPSSSVCLHY
jgi:DMSO/TMAO reductase YedYZ molybdopterin-dependent catalytic subunit